jgi:hypothetical protein
MIKMKLNKIRLTQLLLVILSCCCLFQCRPTFFKNGLPDQMIYEDSTGLAPAQQYAGEVFSYLIQVIVGQAGDPELREDWAARGLDEKLDLKIISDIMTNSFKNKNDIMLLDPNILGLLDVLYYYDGKLNLYQGDLEPESIYPASELIAMRLLLIQKIYHNRKISLESLFEKENILTDQTSLPTEADLAATNLRADEMQLLKEIVTNKPYLYDYLKSPFLINAFYKIGAVEFDNFVKKTIPKASYKKIYGRHFGGAYNHDAVKIMFLPSMIKEFHYGNPQLGLSHYGFKPTKFYNEITNKLKTELLDVTKKLVYHEINKDRSGKLKITGEKWEVLWEKILKEKIAFYNENDRPLVIYPGNAEQVIREITPKADFSIIILDKNVYRSIYFDTGKDIYPHVNRLYTDIMDIKYSQTVDLTDQVSRFIYSRIKDDIMQFISEDGRLRAQIKDINKRNPGEKTFYLNDQRK